jgi:hypothetical protein
MKMMRMKVRTKQTAQISSTLDQPHAAIVDFGTPDDDDDDELEDNMDEGDGEDPMKQVVADVLAGIDPAATSEQRERMVDQMKAHTNSLVNLFDGWRSGTDEQKRNAMMFVGYMQLDQMDNQADNQGEVDEVVPKNAPPSVHYLLNANQRAKMERFASTFHEKFAVDFFCRRNWPKYDGILININEVKPNKSGTGYRDESLKKRAKTQISVLAASAGALKRFRGALRPNVDEDAFEYFETAHKLLRYQVPEISSTVFYVCSPLARASRVRRYFCVRISCLILSRKASKGNSSRYSFRLIQRSLGCLFGSFRYASKSSQSSSCAVDPCHWMYPLWENSDGLLFRL